MWDFRGANFVLLLLVCRGCFRRWMRHTTCASMSGLNFVKVLISLLLSLLSILVAVVTP